MAPNSTSETETAPVEHTRVRDWLVIYLKGLAIGAADAVPGVSGGTIALITGIYERLIVAITGLDTAIFRTVPLLFHGEGRTAFRTELRGHDIPFLLVLGTGMATAVVLIARIVHAALETFPAPTFAFFSGLIGASAIILFDHRWLFAPRLVVASILGFTIAFLIAGASSAGLLPQHPLIVFLVGAVAICGMLLPGISGAFILLLLGQYEYLTGVLTRFFNNLLNIGSTGGTDQLIADGLVVGAFVSGAIVGLLTIAHVVRWALESARTMTFAFLVSLMVGALRYPGVRIIETVPDSSLAIVTVALSAIAGVIAVVLLDLYTDDLDYEGTGDAPLV